MSTAGNIIVGPSASVQGSLTVPGDKSISHRTAMLSAIADGESVIHGFLASEDCLNTLKAVEALGAAVHRDGTTLTVRGARGRFTSPAGPLDMGNSGTGIRLMAGLVAGQPFTVEMTGDASLRSRPMKRIKEPLELMGARVELLGDKGCAPVRITGGKLHGIEYRLPVASAQVKSCVLLAGLSAGGATSAIEPKATRDHTERILAAMGARISIDGLAVRLDPGPSGHAELKAGTWSVPGDFSSAAFWLVAAACREGSDVEIRNVGLNPRRTALIGVLRRMGARIEVTDDPAYAGWEPRGVVKVLGSELRATDIGGSEVPNLIDELPILFVAAAMAEGRTTVRDAAELRVKESDRIAVMARVLSLFGADVEEQPDGMVVTGPSRVRGGITVSSSGDHRVAMASAVMALFADSPVRIDDIACVNTSYPGFWEDRVRLAK